MMYINKPWFRLVMTIITPSSLLGSTRAPCLSERRVDQVEIALSTPVLVLVLVLVLIWDLRGQGQRSNGTVSPCGRAVLLQPRLGPVFA